jgi:hypothetical protein
VWLINNAFWKQLREKAPPERLLLLDGEHVSQSPAEALSRVLSFFEVPVQPEEVTRIANSEAASHHSKRPKTHYDASARHTDLLDWEKRFGDQTDRAIEWAAGIAEKLALGRIDGAVAGVAPENLPLTAPAGRDDLN